MTRLLLLLAGLLPVIAGSARAETLTVGVEHLDYAPHYFVANGEYGGFGRAVIDAFAADRGHTVRYRPVPVARLLLEFLTGAVAFKYPDSPLWAAEEKRNHGILYSAPIVEYVDGTLVARQQLGRGLDAIKVLGTVRGFTAWDWLDRVAAGKPRLAELNGLKPLIEVALLGRVDGVYANIAVARNLLEGELGQPGALVFDPALPYSKGAYRLSSIQRPDVIRAFDSWLTANEPRVEAMKRTHGVGLEGR